MTPNPEFMSIAIDEAVVGVQSNDGGPFGACVVKDGKVISRGHNMVLVSHDVTAHAEVTAIRNACAALQTHELNGCQLYTSCYPCPMCMGAALWARVDAVYYAASGKDAAEADFDDSVFHNFVKNPHSTDQQKWEKIDHDDYLKPFQTWKSKTDRVQY